MSHLAKAKEEILEQFESGCNRERKRQRVGKEEDVGSALFLWFKQKLSSAIYQLWNCTIKFNMWLLHFSLPSA